jgi:hypothetical protein
MPSFVCQKKRWFKYKLQHDFNCYGQNDDGQQNFQLITMEFPPEYRPNLGSENGTDQEKNGQQKVDGMVAVRL